jgi:cytochrome c-type biogenesis protein CcmH/NrfG
MNRQLLLTVALAGVVLAGAGQEQRALAAGNALFAATTGTDPETFIHQKAQDFLAKRPGADQYLQGVKALRGRKFPEAADSFGAAIAKNDEDALFHQGRGMALALQDKYADAARDLVRSLQLDSSNKLSKAWLAGLRIATNNNRLGSQWAYDLYMGDPLETALHYWGWAHQPGPDNATRYAGHGDPAELTVQSLLAQPFLMPLAIDEALGLHKSGQDAEALAGMQATRAQYHNDPVWLYLDADIRLALGRNDDARDEFLQVLNGRPDLAAAYLGLGLANARMGEIRQAEWDFAAAAQIAPGPTKEFRAKHDAEIAQLAAAMPKDPPAKLAADLLAAAGKGEDWPKLTERAMRLQRAVNAVRRRADEEYDNSLRRLEAEVAADPNNSDRWADLAKYVYLEARVRTVWNGPHNKPQNLRNQNTAQSAHEKVLAEQYADQALALNPKNVEALATKAWLLSMRGMNKDALDLSERGLQLAPDFPRLAKLKSAILAASSDTAWAEAQRLRSNKMISGYDWWIIIPPTREELEQAQAYQGMSWQNRNDATETNKRAFRKYAGTIQGYLSRADYYLWMNDYPQAVANYEEILKLDTNNFEALEGLEEACSDLNQPDKALDYRVRSIATMATTAAPLLEQAWDLIGQTRWKSAGQMLDRAMQVDPSDARIYAYNAAIHAWQGQLDDTVACWRCVIALEEARVRLNGQTLLDDHGPPLIKHDAFLAAQARLGLFKALMAQGKTDEAIAHQQAARQLTARATLVSDRTDLPFLGVPAPANTDEATLPVGEDVRTLTAKASLAEAKKALAAGKLEDAARQLTQVRKANYAGGDDPAQTRRWVDDNGYQIYLKLKTRYNMNQLGQFFDGQWLHEFDMRDRGVYQGG